MTDTLRITRVSRFLSALCFTAVLAACGGGGGGGGGGGTTPPATFTVGGTVTGLAGTGLVLQNNAGNNLTVAANGAFTFTPAITSGGAYAVTVLTQPSAPAQTCTVTNGTGSVSANVTNVTVACVTRTFTVGGSVSGLTGAGLVIQNNASGNTTIAVDGNFTFAAPVASGANYAVTVLTQPSNPAQVCTVASGSGTIAAANVTNVTITCASNAFTVGGSVSGMVGTGLVLQNNAGNNLAIAGNGPFTFTASVASGGAYAVTVQTQPSNPAQTCAVTSGTGTVAANVTNVAVTCTTNTYTISGTVSGLSGSGLVLQNNGGNNLAVSAGATSFLFGATVPGGGVYAVSVLANPSGPAQTCVVLNGSGTVVNASVNTVTVTCTTTTYTVGGTISGLAGSGLVLQLNGANNFAQNAGNTSFAFSNTPLQPGASYTVSVLTQPSNPTQTCAVANGTGTISANVTNVTVTCTTNTYTIGGFVLGLNGTGLVLRLNGNIDLPIAVDNNFAFGTPVASGATYTVTVLTQPTANPTQTCSVAGGSGTVTSSNISNVEVTCTGTTYTVGGTVSGLSGTGLVLRNNGGNNLAISANGSFTFPTGLANGAAYAVTVFTSPSSPTQTCAVNDPSGTVAAANVTNVAVVCSTSTYTVGGTVTGLAGPPVSTGLVIRINGGGDITLNVNGPFTFSPALPSGAAYSVTVQTPPTPAKVCSVARGVGTVGAANVTNVAIVCSTTTFTIGGTISGLPAGTTAVLQNNGTNNLTVSANGAFMFTPGIASGSDYLVSVLTNPVAPARVCEVTAGTGSGTATANVTNVVVTCRSSNVYITNALGGDFGVGTFTIGSTGGLTAGTFYTTAPDVANGVAVTPSGSHAFVSVGGAARRIKIYLIEQGGPQLLVDTGNFAVVPANPDPANPKTILVHPSEGYVYVFDAPNGTIRIYQFNSVASTLTNVGFDTVQGLFAVVMRPQGDYLYAASYDFSNVTPFTISGGGASISSGMPTAAIGTVGAEMALAMDPQGRFLFASQQRDELLNAYGINVGTGALTLANSLSTAAPPVSLGVRALAVESTGRFLYAANGDGNILGYSIDQVTGAIAPLAGSPFTASGSAVGDVKMRVDSSGKFLYKTSGVDGSVSVYSINSTTGALTAAGSLSPANGGLTDIALE